MKRLTIFLVLLGVATLLAGCAGQSSSTPKEGGAAADLPPRAQQAGAANADSTAAKEEALLSDAPVVSEAPADPRTGNAAAGAAGRSTTEGNRAGGGDQPQVAALIPNQGPYNPIRELRRVHFAYDADELTAQGKRTLDENARWLLANPEVRVRVEGHCDERGTNEYNLGLGQRRADKVASYLIGKGVSPRVLLGVSFGEEVPLAMGHDDSVWSQNRRVDFSYQDDDTTSLNKR